MAGGWKQWATAAVLLLLCGGECGGPSGVRAGRVLVLFYFPAYSHFTVFEAILKELAQRGHQVDVLSHFPQKTQLLNYTDISLQGVVRMPSSIDFFSFEEILNFGFFDVFHFMWVATNDLCRQAMEHSILKSLAQSRKRYDVVLLEIFGADCGYGYAHVLGAPVVAMTSLSGLPWAHERMSNPDNPAYAPGPFLPYVPRMTFWQRVVNTAAQLYCKVGEKLRGRRPTDALLREQLGPAVPPLSALLRNTSLVMVNSHFSLNGARPTVPGYLEVGGMHVQARPGPLPEKYRSFVEGAGAAGVLVVSFGTLVRAHTMPPDTLDAFVEALGALPQRVVWKVDAAQLPRRLPPNVLAENFLPQQQLLCLPQMRAFITHAGLGSTLEAVYWGVPSVVVPLFSDQLQNARIMEEHGMARVLQFRDVTADGLKEALDAVINNPRYRERAQELSRLFRDRPQPPLQTAVYWTEYVMRHRGAPHLRSAAVDLAWYELWLLDVAAALLAALALLLATLWLGTRAILRCLCTGGRTKQKVKTG